MGVPGFFKWLKDNKKKLRSKNLIRDSINKKVKYLMLDTNCLLHPCVKSIKDNLKKDTIIFLITIFSYVISILVFIKQ